MLLWSGSHILNYSKVLIRFIDLRVAQFKLVADGHELKLFPYCRLVDQMYHSDQDYSGI